MAVFQPSEPLLPVGEGSRSLKISGLVPIKQAAELRHDPFPVHRVAHRAVMRVSTRYVRVEL